MERIIFLLLPLIPYFKVLQEVINPVMFIFISIIAIIRYSKKMDKMDLYILLIFLLGLVSIAFSKDKIISLLNSTYVLVAAPMFVLSRHLEIKRGKEVNKFIFWGGAAASVLSIIRYLTHTDLRLDGLFNYANASALYFGICTIIFFSEEVSFKNSIEKYASRFGIVSLITALMLTQSKGGILIFLIAAVCTAFLNKEKRQAYIGKIYWYGFIAFIMAGTLYYRQYSLLILLLPVISWLIAKEINLKMKNKILIYMIAALTFSGTAFALIKTDLSSFIERFVFYEDGLRLLRNNLFGIGAGRFSYEQFSYQTAMYDARYVHNGFLQIAIDYGILFLIFYVGLLIYIMTKKLNKQKVTSINFVVPMMILLHSLVDFSLNFIIFDIIMWYYLGLGYGIKDGEPSFKLNCKVFSSMLIASSLALILFIPGEVIYTISTLNRDRLEFNYKVLKIWSSFPIKTIKYYDQLSVLDYELYFQKKEVLYLREAEISLKEALNLDNKDGRIFELLGKVYFAMGDYKKASQNLEKSIEERKYHLRNYDALIECYYNQYKRKDITEEEYAAKLKDIEKRIVALGSEINSKSRYMKNQPNGNLNEYESMRVKEVGSIVGKGFSE